MPKMGCKNRLAVLKEKKNDETLDAKARKRREMDVATCQIPSCNGLGSSSSHGRKKPLLGFSIPRQPPDESPDMRTAARQNQREKKKEIVKNKINLSRNSSFCG
jgi:hypothetical protein